jgi:hypothetical protein
MEDLWVRRLHNAQDYVTDNGDTIADSTAISLTLRVSEKASLHHDHTI